MKILAIACSLLHWMPAWAHPQSAVSFPAPCNLLLGGSVRVHLDGSDLVFTHLNDSFNYIALPASTDVEITSPPTVTQDPGWFRAPLIVTRQGFNLAILLGHTLQIVSAGNLANLPPYDRPFTDYFGTALNPKLNVIAVYGRRETDAYSSFTQYDLLIQTLDRLIVVEMPRTMDIVAAGRPRVSSVLKLDGPIRRISEPFEQTFKGRFRFAIRNVFSVETQSGKVALITRSPIVRYGPTGSTIDGGELHEVNVQSVEPDSDAPAVARR